MAEYKLWCIDSFNGLKSIKTVTASNEKQAKKKVNKGILVYKAEKLKRSK